MCLLMCVVTRKPVLRKLLQRAKAAYLGYHFKQAESLLMEAVELSFDDRALQTQILAQLHSVTEAMSKLR